MQCSTDQYNSVLQSETTKNFSSIKCNVAPSAVFFPQVVLRDRLVLSTSLFSVANLGTNLMDKVCGAWQLDQFRSPRGTCKLEQNSRLHHIDVLLLCWASSLYFFTWFNQTNIQDKYLLAQTKLTLQKNVCKLPVPTSSATFIQAQLATRIQLIYLSPFYFVPFLTSFSFFTKKKKKKKAFVLEMPKEIVKRSN